MKKKVNILTLYPDRNCFLRQLDEKRFSSEYEFYENSTLDHVWDYVVVYEGLTNNSDLKVKKGGLIFISGEPPWSRVYSKRFLHQFDHLITSHPNIKHISSHLIQQGLNWHFGYDFTDHSFKYDFKDLVELELPIKSKNISVICSSKKLMPGHLERKLFIEKLKMEFQDDIDFYGKEVNPIKDKSDAILPYRFHICIENCSIENYWTEKFADPLLGFSVPLYHGCTNIDKYFDKESFIEIDPKKYDKVKKNIKEILDNPENLYNKFLEKILREREKLLHKYNLFPMLVGFINDKASSNEQYVDLRLRRVEDYFSYKFALSVLRGKRFLYKKSFDLIHPPC